MPASLVEISDNTPMGANLTGAGATFRVWAPHAHRVHACVNGAAADEGNLLTANEAGHWRGFLPGVRDRDRYKFFVVGDGGSGPKRDPFARELATPFPGDCVDSHVRFSVARNRIRHAAISRFRDLSVARRRFFTPNLPRKAGTFLDVAPQDSAPREPRRHGHPADADPGVPHANSVSATTASIIFRRKWITPSRMRTCRRTSRG